jgi:glycosyltransferase involved in cell wall biosynthesis
MVVTNVGGLKEMCPDGKVGYVVNPNPHEIKNAILKFFDNKDSKEMIENIKEIKTQYSWSIFTKNLLSLLSLNK